MPRDGSNVYHLPAGTSDFVANTVIESAKIDALSADLEADNNTARPIVAGGTGAATAIAAHDALVTKGTDVATASTVNLDNATGWFTDLTGTTTVTAVTLATGKSRICRAVGVFQLTASASLIVNGSTSVNLTTAAGDLLIFEGYASSIVRVWLISPPAATSVTTFSDSAFRVQDNGDATKQLAFEVSGITTGNTRTLTPPNASATIAALDVEDQTLTGGARVTSKSLGTPTNGSTVTLDPGDRPIQHLTNNVAGFTLAPGSNGGSIILEILNGASAGTITTSGFTKVSGDSFTTTNGHKFHCSVIVGNAYSSLSVLALQ
jgi:hypothetical protein